MAKRLYCPQCNVEYWGESKRAKCSCGYTFTFEDKRKALGLTTEEYKIIYAQERRTNG